MSSNKFYGLTAREWLPLLFGGLIFLLVKLGLNIPGL